MNEFQVSMSKLRQNLGSLVNRAAYGGERVVLVAHGEPKAAIIGIEDLRRLRQLGDDLIVQEKQPSEAIDTDLREIVREVQAIYSIEPGGLPMTLKRDDRGKAGVIERLRLAKLLLESVLGGGSAEDEGDWSALGLRAFEEAWDNPDDAIYDDWRKHYDVSTG